MKYFCEWMMKLLVMSNFEFPLQSVTVHQICGWSEKILYCGQGCVSARVVSENLSLYYGFSEYLHLLFSWLSPQQRSIFGHSTYSYSKHYIMVFLSSGSGYPGHLSGMLCNLEYFSNKVLWGELRDMFGAGVENLTLHTLTGLNCIWLEPRRPVGLFAWLRLKKEF